MQNGRQVIQLPQTLTLGGFYGVYNCSTLHNDHDIENIVIKIKNKQSLDIEM